MNTAHQDTPSSSALLRIRPTFLMLFLALVVPVSALSLWFTMQASNQASERLAQESIARAQTQTDQATQILLRPITAMLTQLAQTVAAEPELLRTDKGAGVLLAGLLGVGSALARRENGAAATFDRDPKPLR